MSATKPLPACLAFGFLCMVNASSLTAAKSDQALFHQAQQAYEAAEWVQAAMFLQAYVERDPLAMKTDPAHAKSVREAIDFSQDAIRSELAEVERQLKLCRENPGLATSAYQQTMFHSLLPPQKTAGPPSYPLICRGGEGMYFNYTPYSNLDSHPQLFIDFSKGSHGVGKSWEHKAQLPAGHCAWVDRPVDAGEPDRLVLMRPVFDIEHFTIAWSDGSVRGTTSGAAFTNLQRSDRLQEFMVYNNGQGMFIVTGVGKTVPD